MDGMEPIHLAHHPPVTPSWSASGARWWESE
jgi:hypothetical protein